MNVVQVTFIRASTFSKVDLETRNKLLHVCFELFDRENYDSFLIQSSWISHNDFFTYIRWEGLLRIERQLPEYLSKI